MNQSNFLIEGDRTLIALPELVELVGLEPAIILEQVHRLLRKLWLSRIKIDRYIAYEKGQKAALNTSTTDDQEKA